MLNQNADPDEDDRQQNEIQLLKKRFKRSSKKREQVPE